ncbi:MAG: hypothetical protein WD648_06055 [Planctomycetaceae bacterium]
MVILSALDPAGDFPNRPQGPGLTLDESYNVEEGVRLSQGLQALAIGAISIRELFGVPQDLGPNAPLGYHNPDHPPLGRLMIGVSHDVAHALDPPPDIQTPFAMVSARTGSALAFAITVFLTGWMTARWYGHTAGLIAAVALVLMPRLFGHAHIAALESSINLAYAAAVFVVADRWTTTRGKPAVATTVSLKAATFAGVIFGLALLTKIQAILIPIPLALWALAHWRQRALLPLLIWGTVALAVFFALWPWLWLDPVAHLKEYFGRTTERLNIHVWYFGARYADVDVPWHYPWVMFLTTVPVGLHALSVYALVRGKGVWTDPRTQLLLACIVFPLLVFSLPGVAVYDGERLFSVVFVLWAVFVGRGGANAYHALKLRWSRAKASAILAVVLAAQAYGSFAMCPCFLSYYNLLVGGLPGASRVGLDVSYWRDSVTREFLESVVENIPRGGTVILVPVLNEPERLALVAQSPILRRHQIQLVRWDQVAAKQRKYALVFRRNADVPPVVDELLPEAKLLAEVRRQGVQLAALYEMRASDNQ